MTQTILIPRVKLTPAVNARGNWRPGYARDRETKGAVMLALRTQARLSEIVFPVRVTITRIGPRALDSDNATGSAKTARDTVAAFLGVDDGKAEREGVVEWRVEQRKGAPKTYGVEIRLEHVADERTPDELAAALERAKSAPRKAKARTRRKVARRGWGLRAIGRSA